MVTTDDLDAAHLHSFRNRPLLEKGGRCGCFFCLAEYDASAVTKWVDDGRTALCPQCGIDSVLSEPYNDPTFLREMQREFFGRVMALRK